MGCISWFLVQVYFLKPGSSAHEQFKKLVNLLEQFVYLIQPPFVYLLFLKLQSYNCSTYTFSIA